MKTQHKRKNNRRNKTKKTKKSKEPIYKKLNCSPNPNKIGDFTCYSSQALFKIKELWNKRHTRNKILTNEPVDIWKQLKENMGSLCDRESCWLKRKFMEGNIDKKLMNYTFAPSMPKKWLSNPTEWLSSLDIESVMKQYEQHYKCFEFLGPSPIDYDTVKHYGECVWEELCKFSLKDCLMRNKNKIGVIFNTHPHNLSGEHWISLFINIKKKFIIYFDSNGRRAPKQIDKFINTVVEQGKKLKIDFKIHKNTLEHQQSDSECGMYCLYFIIEMLKDKSGDYFLKNKIDDSEVFKMRAKYFNHIDL